MEGAILKSGGLGFEGLDLEIVDSSGAVVANTRTDYDGYFLFEGVAYGSYSIRLAKSSAEAVGVQPDLHIKVTVTEDRPIVRTGSIQLAAPPKVASAQ